MVYAREESENKEEYDSSINCLAEYLANELIEDPANRPNYIKTITNLEYYKILDFDLQFQKNINEMVSICSDYPRFLQKGWKDKFIGTGTVRSC